MRIISLIFSCQLISMLLGVTLMFLHDYSYESWLISSLRGLLRSLILRHSIIPWSVFWIYVHRFHKKKCYFYYNIVFNTHIYAYISPSEDFYIQTLPCCHEPANRNFARCHFGFQYLINPASRILEWISPLFSKVRHLPSKTGVVYSLL